MKHLADRGCDYLERALRRCREKGIGAGVSIRMNDTHNTPWPDDPVHGDFYTARTWTGAFPRRIGSRALHHGASPGLWPSRGSRLLHGAHSRDRHGVQAGRIGTRFHAMTPVLSSGIRTRALRHPDRLCARYPRAVREQDCSYGACARDAVDPAIGKCTTLRHYSFWRNEAQEGKEHARDEPGTCCKAQAFRRGRICSADCERDGVAQADSAEVSIVLESINDTPPDQFHRHINETANALALAFQLGPDDATETLRHHLLTSAALPLTRSIPVSRLFACSPISIRGPKIMCRCACVSGAG
jgi:hypothetical protein